MGTLPSRGSSGETRRSRSPRKRSTTTPKRWLRSLATTTGNGSPAPAARGRSRPGPARAPRVASTRPTSWSSSRTCGLPSRSRTSPRSSHHDAVDPAQGEGVGLAGDLDQQGADDRDGDRQLEDEPRPLAGPGGDADRAADRVHHAVHHVQPDAPAGDCGDRLLGREARAGRGSPAARPRPAGGPSRGRRARARRPWRGGVRGRRRGRRRTGPVWSIPARWRASRRIVPAGGLPAAGAPRAARWPWSSALRIRWFSGASSLSRMSRSTPVVSPATSNRDLLAQLAGQVADQPGEAADAVGQRPHPAGQHLVVQPAGEVLAPPREVSNASTVSASACMLSAARPRALARSSARRPRRPSPGPASASAVERRSSRTCSVSIRPLCRSRSRQSASTNGRSRWVWTRASPPGPSAASGSPPSPAPPGRVSRAPARPASGRLRGRGRAVARPRLAVGPSAADRACASPIWLHAVRRGSAGVGPASASGRLASTRPSLTAVQVGDQGVDLGRHDRPARPPARPRRAARSAPGSRRPGAGCRRAPARAPVSLLGGDEAVLHRVGDPDRRIEPDDPRRPLERVGRPHQRLDHRGRGRRALQRHQARRERRGVALGLDAEEVHQREAAQVAAQVGSAGFPRRKAAKTRCSSSRPTLRPSQEKTAWLKPTAGLTRVEGTVPHWPRGTRWTPATSSAAKAQVSARARSRRTTSRGGAPGASDAQQAVERDAELGLALEVHQSRRRCGWCGGGPGAPAGAW